MEVMKRSQICPLILLLGLSVPCATGCTSPWFSKKDELRSEVGTRRDAIRIKLQDEQRPTLVKEIASPAMLTQARIENIGLMTQLWNTGGIVNASQQREKMLDVMRRKEAETPNAFLDDPTTALVVTSSFVPPAAQRGDRLDVVVKLSSHAEGSSLLHGWLMETPLLEMSLLGGEVREGFDLAKAEGYVVTDQQRTGSEDPQAALQGIIVGGARLLKGRDMGISVDAEYADAITMSAIVPAINRRFTYFNGQKMGGVATPQESSYIDVKVPPRYQQDPYHYINVVLRVAFNESSEDQAERMETLKKQLREPTTVREACWQLEALGEGGIPLLAEVLDHPDPEISFYVAHSLAYLDDVRAIPKLSNLCLREPAFRAMCFNGLVAIESYEAGEELKKLAHAAEPEVKYGAIRALRRRDASDRSVASHTVGETGQILEFPSMGPPLVAVSLSQVPEIVMFGCNPQLHIGSFQMVNQRLIIAPESGGKLNVSYFSPGEEDRVVTCDADLRSVLTAIADVGGTYGDWVNFVRQSHEQGNFFEPMALNPVPQAGRTYSRQTKPADTEPGDAIFEQTYLDISSQPGDDSSGARKTLWNPLSWVDSSESK